MEVGGSLPGVRIAVLGRPRVTRDDGTPVDPGSAKATALLLYLAVTGERHSRSALAGLPAETTPGGWGREEHLARSRELFDALGAGPALPPPPVAG